ncbi:hypothetical protein [Streptomyces melanogenes]|uniref:hypothetical protein n=1 Tax=Streptomyces melanogenes TaxID=67326 RepID=UPI00167CE3C5|nr:hypothetical protein [Streptomyces melanogenes]GGP89462.1 hypothetical protein GCM10010278_79940 [Streptomyces melanogenes]
MENRSRRAWRRGAAALAATGVLALAAPALAADPPLYGGAQPVSAVAAHTRPAVIAPGTSGPVRFGIWNIGGFPPVTKDWQMNLYAPRGTTFADAALTPLGDAPGPWHRCELTEGDTALVCYSDDPRSIQEYTLQQWQVNIRVPRETPPGTVLEDGRARFFTHAEPFSNSYFWTSPRMRLAVRTA